MVCPLRLVLALASVALLLYSACVLLLDSPAGEALQRRLARADRSWWRFGVALFTGELVYAFYGRDADGDPLVVAGADAGADAGASASGACVADVDAADAAKRVPAPAAAAATCEPFGAAGCEGAAAALSAVVEGAATVLHQRATAALT